jgi:hypothetical protein
MEDLTPVLVRKMDQMKDCLITRGRRKPNCLRNFKRIQL